MMDDEAATLRVVGMCFALFLLGVAVGLLASWLA